MYHGLSVSGIQVHTEFVYCYRVAIVTCAVQFLFAVHEFLQKKLSPSIHFNTGTAELSLHPSLFIYRLEI